MQIFDILGAAFPPPAPIDVKFYTAKWTQVPVGSAKLDLNRCNESPLRGEKPDFWLRGILPVKIAVEILESVNNRTQSLRKILHMIITDIVINTLLGRVSRHPAGIHCP